MLASGKNISRKFNPRYLHLKSMQTPKFWLPMQLAMLHGFATSYSISWRLIRTSVKDIM